VVFLNGSTSLTLDGPRRLTVRRGEVLIQAR
jgi:hypothetical protein